MNNLLEKCKSYLASSGREVAFATEDGTLFDEFHYADSHAQSVKSIVLIVKGEGVKSIPNESKYKDVPRFVMGDDYAAYLLGKVKKASNEEKKADNAEKRAEVVSEVKAEKPVVKAKAAPKNKKK